MKLFIILALLVSVVACQSEPNKSAQVPQASSAAKENPEDCDEAAKKPIEIKEDTISLNNTTGCTLEE